MITPRTPSHAPRLYGRRRRASATVCGSFGESRLPLQIAWQRRYQQALANAVVAVNAPRLQAVDEVRADRAPS